MDNSGWLGLILSEEDRTCNHCHRPITANKLAVADVYGANLHIRCASHDGWVPSDTEAWTMALYSAGTEVVQ